MRAPPFALACGALCLAHALGARAAAPAEPTPERVAQCVAALTAKAEPLAERSRAGDVSADAQLLPMVTSAFAFIGTAYKQGVAQAHADALLKEAKASQTALAAPALAALQERCQGEGDALYADANFIERALINRAAKARIERLKRPKHSKQ